MLKSSAPDHNHILLGGARTASLMDDDDVWMMMTLNPSWRQFITSSSNGQTEEMQNKELLAGILPQMNNFMVIGKNPRSVPKEELRVIDEEEMKCLSPGLLHGKIDLKSVTYGEARRLHEAVKLIKRLYYNEKFVKDYFIASFYFFFTNVVTDAYHFIVF
ncbi:hypothetical protein TNIN_29301 [Trichonephila inaurata madagascariensis]|uniref:Uncharacterized protein n=1 Tax=Trichonephila inaurata madagascariensis TaxID=2747483 RepID=A0A8X6WUR1_9ARAC|nr:hypothetical protein TNIN_29301 [Trichonephila inaurata madagascariensis]